MSYHQENALLNHSMTGEVSSVGADVGGSTMMTSPSPLFASLYCSRRISSIPREVLSFKISASNWIRLCERSASCASASTRSAFDSRSLRYTPHTPEKAATTTPKSASRRSRLPKSRSGSRRCSNVRIRYNLIIIVYEFPFPPKHQKGNEVFVERGSRPRHFEHGHLLRAWTCLSAFWELLKEALANIEKGKYGVCAKCGGEIEREVLEASPESSLCRQCKQST